MLNRKEIDNFIEKTLRHMKQKENKKDNKMKRDGYTHKVKSCIYNISGISDDECFEIYFKAYPTKQEIEDEVGYSITQEEEYIIITL